MEERTTREIYPWVRVGILLVALAVAFPLARHLFGSWIPTDPRDALVFQGTLLLLVLGTAVIEHRFTKPAEAAVNGLMALITLLPVADIAPRFPYVVVTMYALTVFLLATTCIAVSTGPAVTGWRGRITSATYGPAITLGKARLIFSIVFLFGVLTFYGTRSTRSAILVVFWGVFVVIWPLGIPEWLSALGRRTKTPVAVGRVLRTDAPGIVRVAVEPTTPWDQNSPKIYQQADGKQRLLIPLYAHIQEQQLLGTGICIDSPIDDIPSLEAGRLYEPATPLQYDNAEVVQRLGGNKTSELLGFVVEGSSIGELRFETWRPDLCREGLLVWTPVGDRRVYFQISEGKTEEESLERDRHGYQLASAAQLGTHDDGFAKFTWLPVMNTPVFCEGKDFGDTLGGLKPSDFLFGTIPGTAIPIGGDFVGSFDHHTAILGITGSGKTELAFDIIRHACAAGIKVVCIDLTARYGPRLADLLPTDLSLDGNLSAELGQRLFDVETGTYGAGTEKKVLKEFSDRLRTSVTEQLSAFIESNEEGARVGLITLNEISNTKATLFITELFLTCLLHFARDNPACPRVLVVVEEAHTVMPEPNTMGLGDFDSRGLVGKIAQIALQGRKYGIGLLVVAQRTATVSKTVLTQCNTIISLTTFDETSQGFLGHMLGAHHTRMISNLPPLHAVVFGKAVRSEQPVMVEIPFSAEKAAIPP